jgi:hypothetical protein
LKLGETSMPRLNLNPEAFDREAPDYDDSIVPYDKHGEYHAALDAGRKPIVPSGDFWHWLGETYPAKKSEAVAAPPAVGASSLPSYAASAAPYSSALPSQPAQGGNHGWDAIADKLNKEFAASQPKRADAQHQQTPQPKPQAGAVDWSEIAAKLNSERA